MRYVALLLVLAVAGCGGSSHDADGGGPRFTQHPFDDAITAAPAAYQEVNEVWESRDLDFTSCVADPTPDGTTCNFQAQVIDFEKDTFLTQLGGTTVKVFLNNQIDDLNVVCAPAGAAGSCLATLPTCFEADADASGLVSFPCMPCNARFAVWTYKKSSVTPVTKRAAEFNRIVTATSGIEEVFTISVSTYGLIPGIVGFQPDPALGIVAGKARDCADHSLSNVGVNVDKGTLAAPVNECFCGDDPIYGVGTFYFIDNFPQKQQSVTSEDGLWAFVNVPPGPVTVFGSARRADGQPVTMNVGRSHVTALADTIAIGDLMIEP
ncbi:MAG: hypothetical protein HY903_08635 [Deltaproteobacteria bacterium]|nr:hypothetical protein [Deltaproteobacteria bacterium]